jgi:hypothetical protein
MSIVLSGVWCCSSSNLMFQRVEYVKLQFDRQLENYVVVIMHEARDLDGHALKADQLA